MGLESATYIDGLVAANPVGATDPKGQGDDHIRLIKSVIKATFPNITGPVTKTQVELNVPFFPSGTRMLFQQTAAPTGWTKDVSNNNKALRLVNGTVSSGGTVNFTTAFSSKAVNGVNTAYALVAADLPAHTHTQQGSFTSGNENVGHIHGFTGGTDSAGAHNHTIWGPTGSNVGPGGGGSTFAFNAFSDVQGAHTHNVSGNTGGASTLHTHVTTLSGQTGSIGGNTPHNHAFTGTAIDMAVQYVDVIICQKD